MYATSKIPALVLAFLSALLAAAPAHPAAIFSEGMMTPETISQAPAGFGTHAGSYFIPDATRNNPDPRLHTVWIVAAAGGAPSAFSTGNADDLLAGMFLPADWGAHAGKYLTVGRGRDAAGVATQSGTVFTYTPDGVRQLFAEYPNAPFNQALLAPAGFGTLGGKLILSEAETFGRIDVIAPDPLVPLVEGFADTTLVTQAFGLAFAPAGFGSAGGRLVVSDAFTGALIGIDATGNAAPFANIPLLPGQTGLRQMAFAPTDFLIDLGIEGDLLLVSVAGSLTGGGTLGDVVALDADGAIVASLSVAATLDKFDPRGMLFRPDGSLLISDASDPIVIVTAADFRPGRFANADEPPVPVLLAIGLAAFGLGRMRQSGSCPRRASGSERQSA